MTRQEIFAEIETERAYQDGKWGTAFDDKNTVNDWAAYITKYASNATFAKDGEGMKAEQRKQLMKVATLAVAALEAFDRNNGFARRHYDKD